MSVLASQAPNDRPTPKHCLIDDAESFHYTLWTTLCAQKANGKAIKPTPGMFKRWGESAESSALMKKVHFGAPKLDRHEVKHIHSSWTAPTRTALETWHTIMFPIANKMMQIGVLDSTAAILERKELVEKMDSVWTQMINALDVALHQLPNHRPGLGIPSTPSRSLFPELRAAKFEPSPELPTGAYRLSVASLGTKRESEEITPHSGSDSEDDHDPGSPIKARVKRLRISQLRLSSSHSSHSNYRVSTMGEGQSSRLRECD